MGGIIPEDEEEYDDCLTVSQSAMPAIIDDDIYEELPGLHLNFIFVCVFYFPNSFSYEGSQGF